MVINILPLLYHILLWYASESHTIAIAFKLNGIVFVGVGSIGVGIGYVEGSVVISTGVAFAEDISSASIIVAKLNICS